MPHRPAARFTARITARFTALAATAFIALPAFAQEPIRIGLVTVLTGPQAALGQQVRDGFQLGVKQLGGKMGGRPVEVVVVDDELKPDVAVTKVRGLIEGNKVDFVVGPVFSNILGAIHKPVMDAGLFLISPNAGPSPFAGKACHQNFFVTSYQNDQNHEVLGKVAQDKGYKRAFIMAPNYQAGKDALAGFKRHFKGELLDEVYTPLTQLDFSAELTRIAALKPDVVFAFMPGGLGVNLVRQYKQAGLTGTVPLFSAFTVDEASLPAQQDAALGVFGGQMWAPNIDNAQNKAFVAAYEAAFGIVPASYAANAYDSAMLINSALTATKGDTANKDALRAALKKADFPSVRGKFRFNTNGYPIQDFYLVKVAKRPDGKFQTEVAETVFRDYADNYVQDCPLK
jgi:branched-chain amino acid transport system substrate-binding protein